MSTRSLLIRGGTTVVNGEVSQRDVLVEGETISEVQAPGKLSAQSSVDAEGMLVLPGGVDTHVHLNDVFMGTVSVHNYRTGTLAAAFGPQ